MPQPPAPRRIVASIAGSIAAACLLALAPGCSDDDDSGTGVLELAESGAGTCMEVPDDLGAEVAKLPVVPCDESHTHEIFSVVAYDAGDVFPGLDALNAFVERECVRKFGPYVGVSTFDSTLVFTWLTPTLDSWNDDEDRDILCVLADQNGAPLEASMKGKKR